MVDQVEEFDWVPDRVNPSIQIASRIVGGAAASAIILALCLYAFGVLATNQAMYVLGAAAVSAAFLWWWFGRQFRATRVSVSKEEIVIQTPAGNYRYPWADIDFIVIRDPASENSPLLRFLRISETPYVEARLRRFSRLGFAESGTRVKGLPQLHKRLEMRVVDHQRLAVQMAKYVPIRAA